jgi:hypothetical protein
MNKLRDIFESLSLTEYNEYDHKEYLKWKRQNITIRGIKSIGSENGGGGMLGLGLYTAHLSNRALAKQYGKVYFALNAIPKNPLITEGLNMWEVWAHKNLYPEGKRTFFETKTIEGAMQSMGYDGIIIKGREMVNFNPPDNVLYFENERELQGYYTDMILNESVGGVRTACNTMSVATFKEGMSLIIGAIGLPEVNPKLWKQISKPLKNWAEADKNINKEIKQMGMSGDSMVDESNTWWASIQSTICI